MAPIALIAKATTWPDIVKKHARTVPHRDALVLRDFRLTYAELALAIERMAQLLRSNGVRHGDRVALLSPPRPEAMITFLACAKIGAIWLALNPKYKEPEIDYIVDHARPTLILSVKAFDGVNFDGTIDRVAARLRDKHGFPARVVYFDGVLATCDSLYDALAQSATDVPLDDGAQTAGSADDACMLVYTSGTTGQPKGVLLSQSGGIFRATVQAQYFKTAEPPRILNFSPINHVGGMQFRSLVQIRAAGTIYFQERFKPAETLQLLRQYRINMLMLGPTMLHMLMEDDTFGVDIFEQLEWYISAGAALPVPALKALAQHCPQVATVYGSTESCSTVSYASLHDSFDAVAYTIGWPIPEGEMRVVDNDGNLLAPCKEGELQIRREHSMVGYLNNEKATQEAFTPDGWYRTGDLATMLEDGSFKIAGRIKEMFKSGGYNVYPREVELVLEAHPLVRMAAVVPVDDPKFQQVGHAFVLIDADTQLDEATVRAWCKERLANYKVPKRVVIRSTMPMLAIGKVDKVQLKAEANRNATNLGLESAALELRPA
jgi:acyl-CoA synthetase (AMP-forming)/AMP-acid ligase II